MKRLRKYILQMVNILAGSKTMNYTLRDFRRKKIVSFY